VKIINVVKSIAFVIVECDCGKEIRVIGKFSDQDEYGECEVDGICPFCNEFFSITDDLDKY